MSVIRGADIDDAFTVLDEINELPDELLNDDTGENLVTKIKKENVGDVEINGDENSEAIRGSETLEQCDSGVCQEGSDENKVAEAQDNVDAHVENDCVIENKEACVLEQTDSITKEPVIETQDEIVKEAEVSVSLDETANTELSKCIVAQESEKAETDVTHPYLYIIDTFEYEKDQVNLTTVGSVKTLEETPFYMISTVKGLMKMLQDLRNVKEIGLEVEKATKEYAGTICLILISTRDADYCIDAVRLQHNLLLLTEIFINPKILKIVFRAKAVLACLQQDLHLYVINVFDIQRARAALMAGEYKDCSVNNILKSEYNVERGQLKNADLRKRPLPEVYKTFYRAAPHYFIYIYHDYKNRLILKDVDRHKKMLDEFRNLCKVIFSNVDTMSYGALEDELKNRHKCELELLRKIFNWRSSVAKKKNIKCDMVLHKGGVLNLARQLSTNDDEILSFTNSPHVKEDIENLKSLIDEVKTKYNIRPKKGKNKKVNPLLSMFQEQSQQRNIQQKRKLFDQSAIPTKQKRLEQRFDMKKQHEQFAYNPQNKPKKSPQNNNIIKPKQNIQYRNRNVNVRPWADTQSAAGSLFNYNTDSFNATATSNKRRRFKQPENRYTDQFDTPEDLDDDPNKVFLNPTSVPSSFTFENNSSPINNRPVHQSSIVEMSLGNFRESQRSRRISDEDKEESLYRSLVDLKQARDNISMQTSNYTGNFKPPKYQSLNAIDQKIGTLERKIQQTQARNRYGGNARNNDTFYPRRY